jgi:hypothetical protein
LAQHNRPEDVFSSFPDLKKHNEFFPSLQKLGYDRISDSLLEASTKLFLGITNFLCASLKFLDTKFIMNGLIAMMKDNLTEAKGALAKAVTDLDAAMNNEILFDEKNRELREECEIAMEFLSTLPALKTHDDVRNLRMKDSGM